MLKNITVLADDLDNNETDGVQTVVFGWDGKTIAIDLAKANRAKLARALEPFVTAGRAFGELPGPPAHRPTEQTAQTSTTRDEHLANARAALAAKRAASKTTKNTKPATTEAPAKQPGRALQAVPIQQRSPRDKSSGASTRTMRQWARENGHDVGDTGALPRTVQDAYRRAHPNSA